jgi:hypothetical protein
MAPTTVEKLSIAGRWNHSEPINYAKVADNVDQALIFMSMEIPCLLLLAMLFGMCFLGPIETHEADEDVQDAVCACSRCPRQS